MKYLKFGDSKKYLVFLHGWGADKNSFLWLKNYFKTYSLIFVDFAGFGESLEPKFAYTLSDYVQELYELLNCFDIDELILIGHSFGGRVAIKYAFLHQNEYLNFKLCLVDSAGIKPRRNLKYFFKIWRYKSLKRRVSKNDNLKEKLKNYGSDDYKVLSKTMKQTFVNIVNEHLEFNAKFIKSKTLIVWGRQDKDTKMFMARKLKRLIKDSKLEIIEDAGHYSFLDKPQEFLIILDTFVKN